MRNPDGFSRPQAFSAWVRLTAPLRVLPDFLIIGARRCGTTSLYSYLAAHPGIFPAARKEVHFFDDHYHRGLSYYRCHFPTWARRSAMSAAKRVRAVTGEATPYYLYHPNVPARVHAAVPGAKLIVLLRDPVARAYSHYTQSRKFGVETLSFEEALEAESERLEGTAPTNDSPSAAFSHKHHSYRDRGLYADQLERWLRQFPREQLLVLQSERLFREPRAVTAEVFRYLGLPEWRGGKFAQRNSGKYAEPMASTTRERLTEFYAPHNRRLFELLGTEYNWT